MRRSAEKIMAVAGVFNALAGELEGRIELTDPRVQAALLSSATIIAMGTDTSDMGLLASTPIRDMPAATPEECRCRQQPDCVPHDHTMTMTFNPVLSAREAQSLIECEDHDHVEKWYVP